MGQIVDLFGQPYGGHNQNQKQRPITKSQAGAIITSELDMAIETWNARAKQQFPNPDDHHKAHLFEISFEKFEYSEEAKAKSELFGYAKLSIVVKHEGKSVSIYDKGQNFVKEKDLDNTNAYYPEMAIDCMSFLLSAGLMYNLAINNLGAHVKEPKNSTKVHKPRAAAKSKS